MTELTMTHSSVHFDRWGFQDGVNIVLPLDRLRELADDGVIGSVAARRSARISWTGDAEWGERLARNLADMIQPSSDP